MSDEKHDGESTPEAQSEPTAGAEPTEATATTEPAPVAAAAAPARRLVRRPEGKILGGVCTGIAAYFGVDPVLVRVGFVLVAVLGGGTGLIAYIVMWLVMPMAPEGEPFPPPAHTDWFDASSTWRWTAIGLIILAVVLLSHNLWHFHASLFWGLVLLGLGVALWSREFHGRNGGSRPIPPATGPIVNPPARPPQPTEPITGGGGIPTPPPPTRTARLTPPAPIPSPAARPPSVLGRLVVGAAALAVGIAVLLDNTGTIHVTARMGMAIVLAIIGAGLVIGAWWGRSRWLIFPGAALAFVVLIVHAIPDAGANTGNITWAPTSVAELRTHYRHGAGNVSLDLRNVKFDSQPRTIRVKIAFGNLEVIIPDGVPVLAIAHVTGGNLELFGHETNGFGDVRNSRRDPGDDKIGLLTIRTDAGFGNTEIRRGRPGDPTVSDVSNRVGSMIQHMIRDRTRAA